MMKTTNNTCRISSVVNPAVRRGLLFTNDKIQVVTESTLTGRYAEPHPSHLYTIH